MSDQPLFLAVFLGRKDSPNMKKWQSLSEETRQARHQEGMAAWKAWVQKHQTAIVEMGGPLGKTKTIGEHGIGDTSNTMGAFTVVRAATHEAAARMFEGHPHFTIFPGETIDVMPILPIPGA